MLQQTTIVSVGLAGGVFCDGPTGLTVAMSDPHLSSGHGAKSVPLDLNKSSLVYQSAQQ